ncbi:MAG: hypothetical protein M0R30_03350 [Methanoregula sp.]|uniref:hypothetical protein n=1 Tax=Methanoregula sp. TaxID=2052170 RepID=UPI0025F3C13F|nr:hypothetical protein [Methanoregula sp.]MCK9630656.1 hypothetical protein [Methanoregula sp.]
MDFRARVGLACVLLGCFLGGMVVLDQSGEVLFPPGSLEITPGTLIDQVFSKAGFQYGPQIWRPGYDPLGIEPGQGVIDNETWYLMFIDLNATPVSGDPNVKKLGSVRITYNVSDLSGRAAFHTYGLTTGTVPTRTNRQTGYNHCGFVVVGDAPAGSSMPAATSLSLSPTHQYRVAVSNNQQADYAGMTATTRTFTFTQPGSGQGALHITSSLAKPRGEVVETPELNGTFFVTATGNDPGNNLILLLAVDRPQPDGFSLRVRTEFVRTS